MKVVIAMDIQLFQIIFKRKLPDKVVCRTNKYLSKNIN